MIRSALIYSVHASGPKGDVGPEGQFGSNGNPGPDGDQGQPGPEGERGEEGCKGTACATKSMSTGYNSLSQNFNDSVNISCGLR